MEKVRIEIEAAFKDSASKQADALNARLNKLEKKRTITMDANTKNAESRLGGLGKRADGISKKKRSLVFDLTDKASSGLGKIKSGIKAITGRAWKMTVGVVDHATRPLRKLFNFATSLKGIMTGVLLGGASQKFLQMPAALADSYTKAMIGYENMLGSKDDAKSFMKDVENYAIKTPFGTQAVVSATQSMMRMGVSDKDSVFKDLTAIGDAVSATGGGADAIAGITLAFSQMAAKGKVSSEELNQLAERGVMAKDYLLQGLQAKGISVSNWGDVEKLTRNGSLDSRTAIGMILEGMKNDTNIAGAMERNANETLSGIKEQIADTFETNIFKRWGLGLTDAMKPRLGKLLEWLDDNNDKIKEIGDNLYDLGSTIVNGIFDFGGGIFENIQDMMAMPEWAEAGLVGKARIVFDEIVVDPIKEWWLSTGIGSAQTVGDGIWDAIKAGTMKGLSEIGSSFKDIFTGEATGGDYLVAGLAAMFGIKQAGKLGGLLSGAKNIPIIGDMMPDFLGGGGDMTISAGAVYINGPLGGTPGLPGEAPIALPGKVKKGPLATVGSFIGGGLSKTAAFLGSSATGAGAMAVGGGAIAGGISALTASISGIKDIIQGRKWEGGAKLGMVGSGAATGALVGSAVPVVGTAAGGLIGAGLGGIAALFKGKDVGAILEKDFGESGKHAKSLGEDLSQAGKTAKDLGANAQSSSANLTSLASSASVAANNLSALGGLGPIISSISSMNPSPGPSRGPIQRTLRGGATLQAHEDGGIFTKPHMAIFAENGPEAVIPMNKPQGKDILQATASKMGVNLGGGGNVEVMAPVTFNINGASGNVLQQIEENANQVADLIGNRIAFRIRAAKANEF